MPRAKRKVELQDPINNFELYDWKSGIDVINVLDYEGVEADGETDVTDILNDMAQWGKTLYFPAGDYRISDTVTFVNDILADQNARLLVYGGNPGVVLGTDNTVILTKRFHLPQVINMVTPTWTAANLGNRVGVLVKAFYGCDFYFSHIKDFSHGVKIVANSSNGFSYNRITFGILRDNAINLYLYPEVGGWVNENWFFGGRYQQPAAKGINITGVFQMRLDTPEGNYAPNNNHFFGASLEGGTAQSAIYCKGYYNQWFGPRFEATQVAATWGSDGAVHARFNTIYGGVGVDENAVFVNEGNARENTIYRNTVFAIPQIRVSSTTASGQIFLQNQNSSTNPAISIFDTSVDFDEDDLSSGWNTRLGANYLQGKLKSDTHPRLQLDFANGTISLGSGGSTALSSTIDYSSAQDSFTFNKEIELTENGDGLILRSSNGTLYRITVADNGTIQANAVGE